MPCRFAQLRRTIYHVSSFASSAAGGCERGRLATTPRETEAEGRFPPYAASMKPGGKKPNDSTALSALLCCRWRHWLAMYSRTHPQARPQQGPAVPRVQLTSAQPSRPLRSAQNCLASQNAMPLYASPPTVPKNGHETSTILAPALLAHGYRTHCTCLQEKIN